MRKALILALLLVLLTGSVQASDGKIRELENSLPGEVQQILEDRWTEPHQLKRILNDALEKAAEPAREAVHSMVKVLLISVLCCLLSCWDDHRLRSAAVLAGTLGVVLLCAGDLRSIIGKGAAVMEDMSVFSKSLLPVMASAAAGTGSPAKAGVLYSVVVLFSNVFIWFCRDLLIPMIYGGLALAAADSVLQDKRLQGLGDLVQWFIKFGLKTMLYCFTGFLTMTGILSGSADALALKAAKITLSGMVPVVGSIISDAADTVLSGAALVKNTVGTFGMVAAAAIFAAPFLQMAIQYLLFRLTAAVSGVFDSGLQGLLKAVSDSIGAVLAMSAGMMLMVFLSCLCLMRTVQP